MVVQCMCVLGLCPNAHGSYIQCTYIQYIHMYIHTIHTYVRTYVCTLHPVYVHTYVTCIASGDTYPGPVGKECVMHACTCPHLYCPFYCHTGLQEAQQVETGWGELYLVRLGGESRKQRQWQTMRRGVSRRRTISLKSNCTYVRTYIVAYITLTDNIQCMYIHTSQTANSSKLSADTEHREGGGLPSVLNRVNLPQSTAARGRSSKTR